MKRYRQKVLYHISQRSDAAWRDLALTFGPVALLILLSSVIVFWLVNPAPPNTITISAGPRDSSFQRTAQDYAKILARNRITLKVLISDGSAQNLARLLDPKTHVDLALIQGGVSDGLSTESLMSLGSIFYVPIFVFYRGEGVTRLQQLSGKRIAIGREGSGTRLLSLNLLKANGIEPGGDTALVPLDGMDAATQLVAGNVDAVFLNGDSAARELILRLLHVPGISLMNFEEASAYTRIFSYLDEIDLPPGVLDLGRKIPINTVHLLSPTVEIVARSNLHPAISDLLIEAAQEVNSMPGLLQRGGQFPAPVAHEYKISTDAARYYKSGKSFLYRTLPFWLASLVDRVLVLVVPAAVLLSPALRSVPALLRWRVKSRIYRFYGLLIAIERGALGESNANQRVALLNELDRIEEAMTRLRMPLAHADAFYVLREHVGFVRKRLSIEAR